MARAVIAPVLAAARGYGLVVTSASAGEGKTVVSAHLAARFARSGLRTLLIDTDVRQPKIAQFFGLKSGPGFGEWVSGATDLSEIAVRGPVAGLDIVVAGGCDARTVAELIDLRFPELLRAAKQEYDVVVLDTAPLLCTPETLALSRLADGVLLAAMRDVSRVAGIQSCTERLAAINAHVLGAVVTGGVPVRYGPY
jgi:capsular exopolysaccharide synthesis family protein